MTGIQKLLTQGDFAPHNWLLHSVCLGQSLESYDVLYCLENIIKFVVRRWFSNISFSLDEQNIIIEGVATEYTECFIHLPNNNSAAVLSNQD